jgi:inhibitor of KinA sporulation pathway (predicted exonuclease)
MARVIIFDLEYTTWQGALAQNWDRPEWAREVIQIGSLRVDPKDWSIHGQMSILVKPTLHPNLSEYCQKLTGITQDRMDANGLAFAEAIGQFHDFCGDATVCSYGDDPAIIAENAGYLQAKRYARLLGNYTLDLRLLFHTLDPTTKGLNSGKIAHHYGLELPDLGPSIGEHDALYDCHSLLAGLAHLLNQHPQSGFDQILDRP